eukprot:1195498-Prorocentrum_minimum.AAC.3
MSRVAPLAGKQAPPHPLRLCAQNAQRRVQRLRPSAPCAKVTDPTLYHLINNSSYVGLGLRVKGGLTCRRFRPDASISGVTNFRWLRSAEWNGRTAPCHGVRERDRRGSDLRKEGRLESSARRALLSQRRRENKI